MFAYKGSFAANTGTGNQTISGIVDENAASFTPKAILIWTTFGTSAAFAEGWTYQMGITDGTNSFSACTAASDNATPGRSQSFRTTSLVRVINSAGTTLRTGAFVSFGSGQFVINWTTATGSSEIFHYIAFGGTDLSVNANSIEMGDGALRSAITLANVTGMLNLMAFGSPSGHATGTGIGWLIPKQTSGNWQQGVACTHIRDNVNPAKTAHYQRTDQYTALFTGGSDLTIFHAAGRDYFGEAASVTGSSSNVHRQTLGFAGIAMAAGSDTQKTSTGTKAVTGLGFAPKAVIIVSCGFTASSSAAAEARLSLGGADRTRQGHTYAGAVSGNADSRCVTNEDTSNIISCRTPNATAASTTTESQAAITLDSDGFTLNWGTADATAREFIYLAFGDAPTPSGERSRTFVGMA